MTLAKPGSLTLAACLALFAAPALGVDADISDVRCVPSLQAQDDGKIPWRPAGTPLIADVTVENQELQAIDVGWLAVGLTGNAGNTLGNMGVYGPFQRNLSGTVEAATLVGECFAPPVNQGNSCSQDSDCDDQGGDGICNILGVDPGVATFQVKVVDALPADLEGTVAVAGIRMKAALNGDRTLMKGFCEVEVRP